VVILRTAEADMGHLMVEEGMEHLEEDMGHLAEGDMGRDKGLIEALPEE
jgi:hypothetical protein